MTKAIAQPKTTKEKRKQEDKLLIEIILTSKNAKQIDVAQRKLYNFYHPVFLNYMMRSVRNEEDAKDLAVRALTRAFNKLESYNPSFAFSTWLQRIATNLMIDSKRKSVLEVQSLEDMEHQGEEGDNYGYEIKDELPNPVEVLEREDRHTELHSKLASIAPESSNILTLRYFEELSYDEIANKLNMPLGTVKAKLFRAKSELNLAYVA